MRISNGVTKNSIRAILILLAMVSATFIMPFTLMASYDDYTTPEMFEMLRADGRNMVLFDPTPGRFTEDETQSGVRFQPIGQPLPRVNFPPDPIRDGHVFAGWRLGGNGTHIDDDLVLTDMLTTLEAMWYVYGQEPAATPTPQHETSPTPTPTPQQTATPTPTPPTSQSAGAPNPPTSPITISLMIFGAVTGLGLAAFGIISLYTRQSVAVGRYRTSVMRYKRESRLVAILGIKSNKPRK